MFTRRELATQIKLLSDSIWGDELGMVEWITSEEEWCEILEKFSSNIFWAEEEVADYLGNMKRKVVGLLIVSFPKIDISDTEEKLKKNEWLFSHADMWEANPSENELCYFSEIIVHKDFRGKGVAAKLIKQFYERMNDLQVESFYITAVTADGQKIVDAFANTELVSVDQDGRALYKVRINEKE